MPEKSLLRPADYFILCSMLFALLQGDYSDPEPTIPSRSRASFSQTLNLVAGRQYELSYFQGFLHLSGNKNAEFISKDISRVEDVFLEFVVYAQLNGIQVTPPVHVCGGKPPGSCELDPKGDLYPVYWEEVKAIVSSPMAETTLSIIFETVESFNTRDHIWDRVYHTLDKITMTAL